MKRLLTLLAVFILALILTGCQPTVIEEGQVVVRDNTSEVEDLTDTVDSLQLEIAELKALIEALDLNVTTEAVDLTNIEGEIDWIEDELELLRTQLGDYDLDFLAIRTYLSTLADVEIPDSPSRNLYLTIGDDYYFIWINDDATYTIKFTYEDPLIGDTVYTMAWISKEIDYTLDGQFMFDIVYGESTVLYQTQITETITVASILDEWKDYEYVTIAAFYSDVRTCVLANTCATEVPVINQTE